MIHLLLFRRRMVWLPTIWGALLVAGLGALSCIFAFRGLDFFLAENDPVNAKILVVEGWLDADELDQAAQVFKIGNYERIVTTGGPISEWPSIAGYENYAQRAADYLARQGVTRNLITAVPCPASAQERTFLSAVIFREWAERSKVTLDAIDVFTSGAHARRSALLFRMALGPKVRVGVRAALPGNYEPEVWWRTSAGMESVGVQMLGLVWVKCCFWPGPPGTFEERWAVLKQNSPNNKHQ